MNRLLRSLTRLLLAAALLLAGAACGPTPPPVDEALPAQALTNGRQAQEAFTRSHRYMTAWLQYADPTSGLIPRNLRDSRTLWNAHDSAADNYAFLVLTAALTDRPLFEGRMRAMLEAETRLTSRLDALPDVFSFTTQTFAHDEPDLNRLIFGGSEYVKDGLLPLTEWLGPSPWSERMLAIVEALWAHAPVETPFGRIVSDNVEVNGEMMQVLARLYWMTGSEAFLDWAVRLGDYYLLGDHHPTRDLDRLRLRDHGCEVISGLSELYATLHFARPEKQAAYREPLYTMLDHILEVGRNDDGLFYNEIQPQTGAILRDGVADTWGYTYNAYYTVYVIDGTERYREAVQHALRHIDQYAAYDWENGSADGYADAIESALNLYNREPLPSVADWIDQEIGVMWAKQQSDGIIEGWHGDGNFARTSLMYALWKTQGVTIRPWRPDVVVGAVRDGDTLVLVLTADSTWSGRILADTPRHETHLGLPVDWTRINQFPEWWTVDAERFYTVDGLPEPTRLTGADLAQGLPLQLAAGDTLRLVIR